MKVWPPTNWHLGAKLGAGLLLADIVYLGVLYALAASDVDLGSVFRLWDHVHWAASAVGFAFFPGPHAVHAPLPHGLIAIYFAVTVVQWFAIGWLIAMGVQVLRGRRHHAL
jgi:hypothetical protein